MKKVFLIIFTAALIFINCGNKNGSRAAAELTADFFKGKIEGEITVYAYDYTLYKSYLDEAARAFEALYPGTKVNIEVFSAVPNISRAETDTSVAVRVEVQNDVQSKLDYISRVNTGLMSGSGADIYAIDVLPLQKFIENRTLENLEPYMNLDPEFNKADYRQNILEALNYRNGIWFLPVEYTFNYYAYDSTLIPAETAAGFGADKTWNTDDLFELGAPLYDGTYKLFSAIDYPRGQGGMFNQLLNENITSFINLESSRANFLDGQFSKLLNSIRNYAEQGYIPKGITGQRDASEMMRQTMAMPTDRYYFKRYGNISLFSYFNRKIGRRMIMPTAGNAMGIEDNDEIAGIQANKNGSVPFNFNQGFGINSQSKNKETAWAFIKFLLSKEMQLSTSLLGMPVMGLPLNNEARQEKAEMTFTGVMMGRNLPLNEEGRKVLEDYKAAVEKLSDSINCYVIQDTSLNDMIDQEVRFFFNGSRTADEAARAIQNKADLYLNE